MTRYEARTAYDVPIATASLANRAHALRWAEDNAEYWPGMRIVQHTARGPRTIWRHQAQQAAA